MGSSRRTDTVRPAADGHILDRADRLLIRIHHLKALHITLLQFPSHNSCQRTDTRVINIRNPESSGIQLVSGPHGTDDRNILFLCPHNTFKLCCHCIHGIYNIVIFFKRKVICIFRQKKTLIGSHIHIRIDFQHPLLHHLYFVLSNGLTRGNNLTVQVG